MFFSAHYICNLVVVFLYLKECLFMFSDLTTYTSTKVKTLEICCKGHMQHSSQTHKMYRKIRTVRFNSGWSFDNFAAMSIIVLMV